MSRFEAYYGVPASEVVHWERGKGDVSLEREIAIFDSAWHAVFRSDRDTVRHAVEIDTTQKAFVIDVSDVALLPGDYHFAVQVRDIRSKKIQIYTEYVTIEGYGGEELRLSDIELAGRISPSEVEDKFYKNGLRILPMPSKSFRRDQNIFVYFEIYNLSRGRFGETKYRVEYTLGQQPGKGIGAKIVSGLGKLVGISKQKGRMTTSFEQTGVSISDFGYVEMDVSALDSGDAAMTVSVVDLNSGQRVSKEIRFRIVA